MQTQANVSISVRGPLRAIGVVLGTAVLATVLTAGLWTVAAARWAAVAAPGPAATADALTLLLAAAALLLLGWLATGVALQAIAVLPGAVGRWAAASAERLTPALAARVAALILGSTVAATVVPGTAVADPTGSGSGSRSSVVATAPDPGFAPTTAPPDPGFRPTRPVVRRVVAPTLIGPAGGLAAPRGVVVHRGDTLWAIAARDLGPDATDAEVAAHWPRWYAANRAVIGPDPDLVLPGQVLAHPARTVTR